MGVFSLVSGWSNFSNFALYASRAGGLIGRSCDNGHVMRVPGIVYNRLKPIKYTHPNVVCKDIEEYNANIPRPVFMCSNLLISNAGHGFFRHRVNIANFPDVKNIYLDEFNGSFLGYLKNLPQLENVYLKKPLWSSGVITDLQLNKSVKFHHLGIYDFFKETKKFNSGEANYTADEIIALLEHLRHGNLK